MITASFKQTKEGELSLAIEGHAGYAEKGKDIVCAGVSTLFYTLAVSLEKLNISGEIKFFEKSGRGWVSSHPKDKYYKDIKLIFDTVWQGIKLLSHKYPDYIRCQNLLYE